MLVGQALRDGLRSKDRLRGSCRSCEAGEEVFEDEASEGRTRSLAASLAYGFENAFTEAERKQLALLHLFQGFVNVDALRAMGDPRGGVVLAGGEGSYARERVSGCSTGPRKWGF